MRIAGQVKKWVLITVGTICVGLGIAGIFLPLLPATPFLLAAAACYAGSSKKFYDWLINNRWFGSYIKNYQEGKGMTARMKIIAVASICIAIGYSAGFVVQVFILKLVLAALAVAMSAYIISLPTYKKRNVD